ncbi:hypothetical protein LTR04_001334 [Oleoguttula sp. CCFEE 6159]|nr:hypothetical protein LTR04_001334 [Oleoguttula sp. CCFEE 6159]
MAPTPGVLYVTMQPASSLPTAQFQDWYNNEHGPTRLRLPFIENGFRYRAKDLKEAGSKEMPEWMAIYDITDMAELTSETYTNLRTDAVKSQREKDTMKQIAVDRRIFDLAGGREAKAFKPLEDLDAESAGAELVAISLSLHPGKEQELDRWYDEEHFGMITKVPGWLRSRRFVNSSIESKDRVEWLTIHEFAAKNAIGGEEHKAAASTPWAKDIMSNVVQERRRRDYRLYYTFGPAPRDLQWLPSADAVPFTSPDGKRRTIPAAQPDGPAIESYITTNDNVVLPYRLEGSSDPDAPLIVLSNSILVEWGIWDGFVAAFLSAPQNRKYRILRYSTRGRSSACGDQPITVDVLASDVVALLDALRVPQAAAVVGVSLGGATALATALQHPARVAAFVSCDTSAKSPTGNRKTWGERIAVAEKEGARASSGESVVGAQLAELTVRRWFVEESYDGGKTEAEIARVKAMVRSNSLDGFKKSVEALFEYDLTAPMKRCAVKGAFVVGGGDGVLPHTMKDMAAALGHGAVYKVIDGAGHLPMVEKAREFADFVTAFLAE